MFSESAEFYDAVYGTKDYAREAATVRELAERHYQSGGRDWLDVACGTGQHAQHWISDYRITGIDLDPEMVAIAARKLPAGRFHVGDMRDFALGQTFDVLTCLFSSIAYVVTPEALAQTLETFAQHLKPGGVALIEPWLPREVIRPDHVGYQAYDGPDYKLVRMTKVLIEGDTTHLHMHYLLGNDKGIRHFEELHLMGLFEDAQYRAAIEAAGLTLAEYDRQGLTGRGLYIAQKPG